MNKELILIVTTALLFGTANASLAADEEATIGGLQIGMTEAQVEALHPDRQLAIADVELAFDGRFGNFTRREQNFEQGLTMYKLRPQNIANEEQCNQFKQSMMTVIEEQFGETQGEITPGEPTWQTDGLWVSLSALWFAEVDRRSAEVFVRATDLTPN
jgi:hypothetical protein